MLPRRLNRRDPSAPILIPMQAIIRNVEATASGSLAPAGAEMNFATHPPEMVDAGSLPGLTTVVPVKPFEFSVSSPTDRRVPWDDGIDDEIEAGGARTGEVVGHD
jgi:hypothetical protein